MFQILLGESNMLNVTQFTLDNKSASVLTVSAV